MKKTIKDSDNYVGYKVRLFPTKEQEKTFYEYFKMNRFVYNLCIDLQEEHYIQEGQYKDIEDELETKIYKRLSPFILIKKLSKLKQEEKYSWLNNYSRSSVDGAIKDCCNAYKKYDNNNLKNGKPKYKSRIYSKKQFYVRNDRLSIKDKTIKIPSIGEVKYCNSYGKEIIGNGYNKIVNEKYIHYYNPRISFDGLYFYLSFSITKDEKHQINSYWNYSNNEQWQEQEESEAIGIDVGLKNDKWFVDSTGNRIERPNSDSLNKKINRLQREYQRRKDVYKSKPSSYQEQHPNGSKNMQKTLEKINKCFKKITNRRRNVVHEYACSLLKKKPKAIVMESISSSTFVEDNTHIGIRKTKLDSMIYDAALYESMMIIENKMINNNIPVIKADSNYPSSQLCSCCGHQQNIGRAKYYRCPVCGTIIDRDLNAAINLKSLAC